MPEIDENMQLAFNNWANLLNQHIIIIFMKSIFCFYDVHIQEKITMKGKWTETNLIRGSNNDRTEQPMNHDLSANF